MTRALATVARAARNRDNATRAYLNAIRAARSEGHTLATIGQAAGVTRQSIHDLLRRHEENRPA